MRVYAERKNWKETFFVRVAWDFFHFPFFLALKQANFFSMKMTVDRMKVLETTKNPPRHRFIPWLWDFYSHFKLFFLIFHFQSWFFRFSSSSIRASLSPATSLYPFLCLHSTSWWAIVSAPRSTPLACRPFFALRFALIIILNNLQGDEKNDKWKKSQFSTDSFSKRTERPKTLTPTEEQIGSCERDLGNFSLSNRRELPQLPIHQWWWLWRLWKSFWMLWENFHKKLPALSM